MAFEWNGIPRVEDGGHEVMGIVVWVSMLFA